MKRFLIITFFLPLLTSAQEYVDLFRINYGQTFDSDFEGTDSNTKVTYFEAGFTIPIVLNENHAFVTGIDFSLNNLQLFPETDLSNLFSTTLKLGMASTWSEKWSTTIVLLPKIASDYKSISGDDLYIGGIALVKMKKNENFKYRFGIYASQEAFGLFTTPILGWYYLSPNKGFEMDMSLPIAADISYNFGSLAIGMDYFGIGRSFNIHYENNPTLYAAVSSLEFAGYLQSDILEKSILLRAKIGYTTNDYEMYAEGEKIDLGISAFRFGDNREQLNPTIQGGVFIRLEAIYRFHIQ